MNAQTLFDTVVTALRAQGRKAKRAEDGMCQYRAPQPDGTTLKCAAGHILPDALYESHLEGGTITSGRCRDVFVSLVGEAQMGLLSDLQCVHDHHDPRDWETEWQRLAANHNLTYSPPL